MPPTDVEIANVLHIQPFIDLTISVPRSRPISVLNDLTSFVFTVAGDAYV